MTLRSGAAASYRGVACVIVRPAGCGYVLVRLASGETRAVAASELRPAP